MKHDLPIRVRKLQRQSVNALAGGAEVTIVVDTLEETPHLGVMKARIDNMVDTEKALRAVLAYLQEAIDDGWRPRSEDVGPGCYKARQLLAKLDAADRPAHPENPWDVLLLDGEPAPAHCRVRFDNPWPSTQDHKGHVIGYNPGQFEIELLVLPENVQACEDFVRKLWPFKPGERARIVGHPVEHPELALRRIRQVVIVGVRAGEGPAPGTRCFVLRAVEYVPKVTA
jgi:hypothetical protein